MIEFIFWVVIAPSVWYIGHLEHRDVRDQLALENKANNEMESL